MTQTIKNIKSHLQNGQFSQAQKLISQQLQHPELTSDEQQELTYLNAVVLRYLNKLNEAFNVLNELINIQPNNGRAYQELGYCELAVDNIENALLAFHKAVEMNPALVAAWQKIVELFKAQNHPNYPQAAQQLTVLNALPRTVLGAMDLMYEGKLFKAEQVCRNFLAKNKHQVDAMCLLAEIGVKLKVFDDAEFLLESCVNLHPENEQAKALYINLLNRLGKFEQAASQAEAFLQKFSPENATQVTVQATLANCYINLDQLELGKAIYLDIIKNSPERAGIYVQLGHAHKTSGDYQQAVEAYKQAYQIKQDHGDAYWSLANIKTYQFSDSELKQMAALLDRQGISIEDQIHICFSLGKAYEDRKVFESSFTFYAKGNQLKKQSSGYDATKSTMLIEQQINFTSRALFNEKANQGNSASDPIFILGLPRAGSTLIEQILASHSMVDGTMELHNILGIALKLRGRIASGESEYPKNLWQLSSEQLKQLGDMYLRDTKPYRKNAPFFIDKMPNNFIHIGLIKLILPNAKIIDARRAPMACCFSGFKQLFGEGQDFSYDLADIGQYYKDYQRLMSHWDEVLPNQILRVQHEELVNNFETEVRRILEYCQLPFEQACIEFYKTKRNIHTPSAQQVRQPISKQGLAHWKNYKPYLNELEQVLKD
ncbi:tetratricopeptide repeat-containing sulfotransferase family protein [Colwellia sp. MEBiC06753]